MTIANKLRCTSVGLAVVIGFGGMLTYRSIGPIDADLARIVRIEAPLQEAILEMEINVGETARAVLDYIRDRGDEDLKRMHDSEADFERFAAEFDRLVQMESEQAEIEQTKLGRQVAEHYADFKELGDQIIIVVDRQFAQLQRLRRDVESIDALIDDRLQPSIDRSAPQAFTQLEAALDMEINIDELFGAVEGYLVERDPRLLEEIPDAETDFARFLSMFRATSHSADQGRWLNRLETIFTDSKRIGHELVKLEDEKTSLLERFEFDLETIDELLDDQL